MLVAEETGLPPLDYQQLSQIWGDHPQLLARYGLKGPGPWQVLVPGYLIHAANQPRENLPFYPSVDQLDFC